MHLVQLREALWLGRNHKSSLLQPQGLL